MANNRTSYRNILTRGLAVMALLCIYGLSIIGASALLLGASTTSALARAAEVSAEVEGFPWWWFPRRRLPWWRLSRGRDWGLGLGLGLGGLYGPYGYGGYYPTAATIPITATPALAMWFGGASGQPTVGEYAAFRSASDCGRAARPEWARTELQL